MPPPRARRADILGYITDPAEPAGIALRELPEPKPGDHDVLVEVRAYAINRGELSLIQQRRNGWTPGQDVAGVGDRCRGRRHRPCAGYACGGYRGPGWVERASPSAIAPRRGTARIGEFRAAAALPVAGLTALRGLRTGGSLLGRRVLVTGASGGVGTFAVQLARSAGGM